MSESPKVVNMQGEPHLTMPSVEADAGMLETMADLQQQMMDGEIVGATIACQHNDGTVSHYRVGRILSYTMLGALSVLIGETQDAIKGR